MKIEVKPSVICMGLWPFHFSKSVNLDLRSETERRRLEMLGLTPEPNPLEQGQDAALYHAAMSPSSPSTSADNSKMASSKGIPISRGDSNSEYMLMSPQQQQAPASSATLLKRGTPPSSYSNKTNMEIPLKSAGKRNGGGTM